MLELFIKELNISAFSLKSVTYLFRRIKGRIQWFLKYSKIASKLNSRISYLPSGLPTYLINGRGIVVYFQLSNSVGFGDVYIYQRI